MTEPFADLQAALDRVIDAAKAHLDAATQHLRETQRSSQAVDDSQVWRAYVELNDASMTYDELLQDTLGETTPWNVEEIDPDQVRMLAEQARSAMAAPTADDPYPMIISVRQRRDYRIPSVSALLGAGNAARTAVTAHAAEPETEVVAVGEAVLELMQIGDGSLGSLDVPELEPLDGVVVVAEVRSPLDPAQFPDTDGSGPFAMRDGDQLVERVDEHAFVEFDSDAEE